MLLAAFAKSSTLISDAKDARLHKLTASRLIIVLLPIRGTASDVVGIISDTRFMNTVRERRTVTSVKAKEREF